MYMLCIYYYVSPLPFYLAHTISPSRSLSYAHTQQIVDCSYVRKCSVF